MRRSPALSAVLTAAALALAGPIAQVRADPIGTTYELTNNTKQPVSDAVFKVTANESLAQLAAQTPPNASSPDTVLIGTSGNEPVTVLPDSTFHTEANPNGRPFQLQTVVGTPKDTSLNFVGLDLKFGGDQDGSDHGPSGNLPGQNWSNTLLGPGQMVHFSLTPGYPGPLTVALAQALPGNNIDGLTFKKIFPPSTNTPGSNPDAKPQSSVPPVNTPEPLSVLLWSTLAGAGLMRARKFRRATAQG